MGQPLQSEYGSGPAGMYEQREAWLEMVKPVSNAGRLDKIPARRATTLRDRRTAQVQNYYLTRRSFGSFHPNYDLIDWSR